MANYTISLNTTTSTNLHLKQLISTEKLPDETIVITRNQTEGKGQMGNSWESEIDKNLTFSLLLYPLIEAENMFLVSKAVSLGIVNALNRIKKGFCIKWPNDIYFDNKKICGILIENQLIGSKIKYSIIGIGLNVNQQVFLSNAPNPVSLYHIIERETELNLLLNQVLQEISFWYNLLKEGKIEKINNRYFSFLFRKKGYYPYSSQGEQFNARINHIANDGELQLITEAGLERYFYFKEVEFVL